MKKFTGLTRSLLSLAKSREKEQDKTEPREGLPDQGTSGQDPRPPERESSLRMTCFKDFPRISEWATYWKIKKFSLRELEPQGLSLSG